MSMITVVLSAWLLLTLTGWLVLAPLDRRRRDLLLPTAPLFGVTLLVVVLHWTTLVVSVRTGLWAVGAVLIALAVFATRRDRTWWRPGRRAATITVLTAACALVPAVWVLGPVLSLGGSGVAQLGSSNDAFYYVSVTDWLLDHPATDVPTVGHVPGGAGEVPATFSAKVQLTSDLRIGQELTHATVAVVTGLDAERTWYPVTALWVLLLPASGVAAARLLRLRVATGLALGVLVSCTSAIATQLAAQNSDSLLGTALTPLTIGMVLRALEPDREVPRVLAGLTLAGLVGTYTELSPLVGPALAVAVLARRRSSRCRALTSAAVVVGSSVLLAPFVWCRAVRSLLFLGGITGDGFPSSFVGAPLPVLLGRFFGVTSLVSDTVSLPLLATVAGAVAAGVLAALVLSPQRAAYAALVVPGAFLCFWLVTVYERPYTQQRVAQLLLPLLLLVSAAGWDKWLTRAVDSRPGQHRARRNLAPRVAAGALMVGAGGVVLASNAAVIDAMDLASAATGRHVGSDFEEAARWIRQVGGPAGGDTTVLVGDFFSQLWITDALRDETQVSYPMLFPDYQYRDEYWDGQPRRWLLTGTTSLIATDGDAVVRSNDRFALLDLDRARAAVAVPADVRGQGSLVVLRSALGPRDVVLTGTSRPRAPTDVAPAPGFGERVGAAVVPLGATRLRVDLEDTVSARLVPADEEVVFSVTGISLPGRVQSAPE